MWVQTGILLIWICVLTGTPSIQEANNELYSDPEAYAVYAAVLPKVWNWDQRMQTLVVFLQETKRARLNSAKDLGIEGDRRFARDWSDTLENYVKNNRTVKRLQRKFPIAMDYVLVPTEEVNALFHAGGWANFYHHYPRAVNYVSMSAVGFNKEKTQALVTMTYTCGSACAGGRYYFLVKRNGKWVEADLRNVSVPAWAS